MASQMMWQPSRSRIDASNMMAFMQAATDRWGTNFSDYTSLHAWSVNAPEQFWTTLWDFCETIGEPGERVAVDREKMPGARFFPTAGQTSPKTCCAGGTTRPPSSSAAKTRSAGK